MHPSAIGNPTFDSKTGKLDGWLIEDYKGDMFKHAVYIGEGCSICFLEDYPVSKAERKRIEALYAEEPANA